MMRRDGVAQFYQVQVKLYPDRDEEGWSTCGADDGKAANVPENLRWAGDPYSSDHKEPFQSFSASGECWQQYGYHGTKDKELARKMYKLLVRYNPKYQFRVVKVMLVQVRTPIVTSPEPGTKPKKTKKVKGQA